MLKSMSYQQRMQLKLLMSVAFFPIKRIYNIIFTFSKQPFSLINNLIEVTIRNGRFMFERIHNTKEQIYFYERAENHKAKERVF